MHGMYFTEGGLCLRPDAMLEFDATTLKPFNIIVYS
jgi:hypothetical protein